MTASTDDTPFGGLDDRLAGLCAELRSVCRELEASRHAIGHSSLAHVASQLSHDQLLRLARALVRARELRTRHFRPNLFSDPAWDMLLDLYVARRMGKTVSVGSLCLIAGVPASTALRCIRSMEKHGEIVRHGDPHDRRRVFLNLSDEAYRGIERALFGYADLALIWGIDADAASPSRNSHSRLNAARPEYHI